MAIVYKALDMQNSETVAIKILRPELAEDEQLLKRFNHEASAAAALSLECKYLFVVIKGKINCPWKFSSLRRSSEQTVRHAL